MAQQKKLLESLGFSRHESSIYEALLALGSSSPSDLVKKTGIHRPLVYKALAILIEKGLVLTSVKGKYSQYSATSPDRLDKLFKGLEDEFLSRIEDLHLLYEQTRVKPLISMREGRDAIHDAYGDVVHSLNKGDTYYRYSSFKSLNRERFVPKDYRDTRDKKQLERLIITSEPERKRHRDKLGRSIKVVPAEFDLFEYDIAQVIYGDKVAIIDYNSNSAITIENAKFAEFQKKIFKLLFKKL